jgi:hypothetical protein
MPAAATVAKAGQQRRGMEEKTRERLARGEQESSTLKKSSKYPRQSGAL